MDMPFSDKEMRHWGFVAWRCLDDGTVLAVGPMSISNGRLFWDVNQDGYADFYCYKNVVLAAASMMAYDPKKEVEPVGWHRHGRTGRRRPDGDASKEYINM